MNQNYAFSWAIFFSLFCAAVAPVSRAQEPVPVQIDLESVLAKTGRASFVHNGVEIASGRGDCSLEWIEDLRYENAQLIRYDHPAHKTHPFTLIDPYYFIEKQIDGDRTVYRTQASELFGGGTYCGPKVRVDYLLHELVMTHKKSASGNSGHILFTKRSHYSCDWSPWTQVMEFHCRFSR